MQHGGPGYVKQNNLLILSHQKGLQILSPTRFRISKKTFRSMLYEALLRIRDILVRIRIRGLVPLTNGYGSGYASCYCN